MVLKLVIYTCFDICIDCSTFLTLDFQKCLSLHSLFFYIFLHYLSSYTFLHSLFSYIFLYIFTLSFLLHILTFSFFLHYRSSYTFTFTFLLYFHNHFISLNLKNYKHIKKSIFEDLPNCLTTMTTRKCFS